MLKSAKFLIVGKGISGQGALNLLGKKGFQTIVHEGLELPSPWPNPQGIILSPGVPRHHPIISKAREEGIPLWSEMAFGLTMSRPLVIGITGTNGKSTIAELTAHFLRSWGVSVQVAGNIGISLCEYLIHPKEIEVLVLEISSYQLEQSFLPLDIGVFGSFAHDHMDRHGTMEAYFRCKWQIIKSSSQGYITEIVHKEAQERNLWDLQELPKIVPPWDGIMPKGWDPLFRRQNAALAYQAAASALLQKRGLYPHRHFCKKFLKSFQDLKHRLQPLLTQGAKTIWEDSKATNVDACLAALSSQKRKVILLLGGKGKGESFSPILLYESQIKEIYAFGQAAHEIQRDLEAFLPVKIFESFFQAVPQALEAWTAEKNMDLLLAPACSSLDEFPNFEERGHAFYRETQKFFNPT